MADYASNVLEAPTPLTRELPPPLHDIPRKDGPKDVAAPGTRPHTPEVPSTRRALDRLAAHLAEQGLPDPSSDGTADAHTV